MGYYMEAARLVLEMNTRGLRHVHVHMANNAANVAMIACAMDPRLTYSLSIHGSAEFWDVHRLNIRRKTHKALFVRCISNFCKAQIMVWSDPEAWERFHIVHCAVDPDVFAPASPEKRLGRDTSTLRLVCVGRLAPIKGFPLLLEALARVVPQVPDIHLEIVGSGPVEAHLRSQITRLGLTRHVTLAGAIAADKIPEVLDRSDVLVVSSFMEGVPVVLMEAMSKGLVVISTAVAGVPELITHNVTGLTVLPGSIESLAEAILDVAKRRDSLGPMRAAAREVIVREFNLHHQGAQMQTLFEKYVRD